LEDREWCTGVRIHNFIESIYNVLVTTAHYSTLPLDLNTRIEQTVHNGHYKGKGKGKSVPVLNQALRHEDV